MNLRRLQYLILFLSTTIQPIRVSVCVGQDIPEFSVTRIQAENLRSNDFFGRTLGLYEDQVVIGSDNITTARNGGIIYPFTFSDSTQTWHQEGMISGSKSGRSSRYGSSDMELFESRLIIGASGSNQNGRGGAYIYSRSNAEPGQWIEEAFLQNPSEGLNDKDSFGSAVGIDQTFAIVGAQLNDDLGDNVGKVFTYTRNTTASTAKWDSFEQLTASDPSEAATFGSSVAINESMAIVGADGDGAGGKFAGAAYIFDLAGSAGAVETARLSSNNPNVIGFGTEVDISQEYAVVRGSNFATKRAIISIFSRDAMDSSNWVNRNVLEFDSSLSVTSISLDQNLLAVGIPDYEVPGKRRGAVLLYNLDQLNSAETPKNIFTVSSPGVAIGLDVAIHGNRIVTADVNTLTRRGEAFIFMIPEPASTLFAILAICTFVVHRTRIFAGKV